MEGIHFEFTEPPSELTNIDHVEKKNHEKSVRKFEERTSRMFTKQLVTGAL